MHKMRDDPGVSMSGALTRHEEYYPWPSLTTAAAAAGGLAVGAAAAAAVACPVK